MRAERLQLKDFTVFAEANFEFSPGLNVFIGANATGKSHVLKVLYSITRSEEAMGPTEKERTLGKLRKTFRPEVPTSLVRHGAHRGIVVAQADFGNVVMELPGSSIVENSTRPGGVAVFVPANEVLSMYPSFVAAYERRELSFDETVRDLCVDLSATLLRSAATPVLEDLLAELDHAVGGKTVLRGEKFYVLLSDVWSLETPMLAEGLRKLASISHLIRNGSLAEKSILFWDEPEANINPKLIPTVARALLALASAGVQVFIATHDFLLSNELSLLAEYETNEAKQAAPKFFAFSKANSTAPVEVESGATLADLRHNPILEEFAAHYDREHRLFARETSPA